MKMYDAMEIAKYTVSFCFQRGTPISNLQLQLILYCLLVEFYKRTKQVLFSGEMYAWNLGPVNPNVYREFSAYGGSKILKRYAVDISLLDSYIINPILVALSDLPTDILVDTTHQNNSPWERVYQNGVGIQQPIPFELIRLTECC